MARYDFIILGGGAAGFAAATVANELGVRTAMINAGLPLGGTCINVGCVPTKHLLAVAESLDIIRHPRFAAIVVSPPKFDFLRAIAEKDRLIDALRRTNYRDVLDQMPQVRFFSGKGRFVSPHAIEVAGTQIEGERFLIATGSSPKIPPFPGIDAVGYLTNRDALSLDRLPESLVVIGAGPLGLEFAQMFSRFGSDVTILTHGRRILSHEEPEISAALAGYLREEGITIHTRVEVKGITSKDGVKKVEAMVDGKVEQFAAAEVLIAVGVRANTVFLDLPRAGVEVMENGEVAVNEHLRTSASHIFAAGDVIGPPHLETVAAKEGHVAARNALAGADETIDYSAVPHAVFTSPQVASVGPTEGEFAEKHHICACRMVEMRYVPKARAIEDTRGLIKMVIDPKTERIVGVHILAPLAAEMIHEAVLAVRNGMTIDELIDTVHVFPTLSEGIKMAAQAFRRDVTAMSCCVE